MRRLLPMLLLFPLVGFAEEAKPSADFLPAGVQDASGDTISWASVDAEEDKFLDVGFQQKLDTQVPLNLDFRNHDGEAVKLSDYFGGERPVVLALVYYQCPMACNLLLNGMTESLKELKFTAGKEFNLVTVSFDHEETHILARDKRSTYLEEYDRPAGATGWHFLVGAQDPIKQLTEACGFRFKYNERTDEWSHAAGLLILTPQGKISRYLPFNDIKFPKRDLRLALVEAADGKIGGLSDKLFLTCYKYDPQTGKYNRAVSNTLKTACLATVGALGLFMFVMFKKDIQRQRAYSEEQAEPEATKTTRGNEEIDH